ncbi:MAG: hypothetical protein ACO38Q_08245 [Aquiluna sp.]
MIGQQCTVRPLSHRGAGHQQADHVTLAARVSTDAAGVPLNHSTAIQKRQHNSLAGIAGAINMGEHT